MKALSRSLLWSHVNSCEYYQLKKIVVKWKKLWNIDVLTSLEPQKNLSSWRYSVVMSPFLTSISEQINLEVFAGQENSVVFLSHAYHESSFVYIFNISSISETVSHLYNWLTWSSSFFYGFFLHFLLKFWVCSC